jgi:SAM-dependent methyltransferase
MTMSNDGRRRLAGRLTTLLHDPRDKLELGRLIGALDTRFALMRKFEQEPGVEQILEQMIDRLAASFGSLWNIRGKRILDVPCGSNTSRAPAIVHVKTPLGAIKLGSRWKGYTPLFEPWLCRMLLLLGAHPVGVDFGDLDGEAFEHYAVDLGRSGALDFLPDDSFDAVQDSRLFGSPEFTAQFPKKVDRVAVARELVRQEHRLLKPGGVIIHSDAEALVN